MDPTQLYESVIYNRDGGQAIRFVSVPARSLDVDLYEPPSSLDWLADALGLRPVRGPEGERARRITPIEPWGLPFLIDAALGRFPQFPVEFYFDPLEPQRPRRGPSRFAQYLSYEPVIPVESSPLGGKSLAEIVTTATGSVGAAAGYTETGDLLVLLVVPAGIILCMAARGIGGALEVGLRAKLLRLMDVEDPDREQPPET